jgi:hypothetical protein
MLSIIGDFRIDRGFGEVEFERGGVVNGLDKSSRSGMTTGVTLVTRTGSLRGGRSTGLRAVDGPCACTVSSLGVIFPLEVGRSLDPGLLSSFSNMTSSIFSLNILPDLVRRSWGLSDTLSCVLPLRLGGADPGESLLDIDLLSTLLDRSISRLPPTLVCEVIVGDLTGIRLPLAV